MDYTPGAMRNSTNDGFVISNGMPMAKGTRAHQLGMYVVYHAPLQMLCDAPTAYEKYPDILGLLSQVPVSWDETRVLEAKFGEYAVIARRKGNTWWVGGIGDWNEHRFNLDLSFAGTGNATVTAIKDGTNASRLPTDYRFEKGTISLRQAYPVSMKKGGGFLMRIE
jgi:alpha-glucosidase